MLFSTLVVVGGKRSGFPNMDESSFRFWSCWLPLVKIRRFGSGSCSISLSKRILISESYFANRFVAFYLIFFYWMQRETFTLLVDGARKKNSLPHSLSASNSGSGYWTMMFSVKVSNKRTGCRRIYKQEDFVVRLYDCFSCSSVLGFLATAALSWCHRPW